MTAPFYRNDRNSAPSIAEFPATCPVKILAAQKTPLSKAHKQNGLDEKRLM
jgi:hypothetical protein